MTNTTMHLIRIKQNVRGTFENFFTEARQIDDYEIVDGWVVRILRERGFKFETVEESFA